MRALFLVLMALSLISSNVNRSRDGNKRTGLLQFFRCLPVCLRNSDNVVHTGGEGIQSVLSSFYADRFSKEETELAFKRPFCSKYLIESLLTGLACFPLLCCFFGYGEGKGPGY